MVVRGFSKAETLKTVEFQKIRQGQGVLEIMPFSEKEDNRAHVSGFHEGTCFALHVR